MDAGDTRPNGGGLRNRLPTLQQEPRRHHGLGTAADEDDWPTAKGSDLLHWKDMPRHLQFNPYIFTGYRPLLSIWGCIHSLFYIHNETINIITHGKHTTSALTIYLNFNKNATLTLIKTKRDS